MAAVHPQGLPAAGAPAGYLQQAPFLHLAAAAVQQREMFTATTKTEITDSPLTIVDPADTKDTIEQQQQQQQQQVAGSDVCASPYQCQICGKVFAIPARLQRHYRVHTGEKPFKCEFCEKTFSVKENLNVHRRIHTKERPYMCDVCGRAFEHSGKLHRHMRTHTGERPHRCEVCGKTFVQSGQLVIHMRAHTGEKPYVCSYCRKGFTCSKQLKVHTRTHTGEKPYCCDICGKTFGYNHVLKMHKMSHLGEKLYKCTLCDQFFSSRKALDKHIREHEENNNNNHNNNNNNINNNHNVSPTSMLLGSTNAAVVVGGDGPLDPTVTPKIEPDTDLPLTSIPRCDEMMSQTTTTARVSPSLRTSPLDYVDSDNGSCRSSPASFPWSEDRWTSLNDRNGDQSPGNFSEDSGRGESPFNDSLSGISTVTTAAPPRSLSIPQYIPQNGGVPNMSPNNGGFGGCVDRTVSTPSPIGSLTSNDSGIMMASSPSSSSSSSSSSSPGPVDDSSSSAQSRLVVITTSSGEKLVCPADMLMRLRVDESAQNCMNYYRCREEEQRQAERQAKRDKEKSFCSSVVKALKSLIGEKHLAKLGYPDVPADAILIRSLQMMGSQPCMEPSLTHMDRIKVNLRLLLEWCIPEEQVWIKLGWREKSIESIVEDLLHHS